MMQWHRQMYYALYFRAAAAESRGGPDVLGARILAGAHAANLAMLLFVQALAVDQRSYLTRTVLIAVAGFMGVLLVHVFTLDGEELRKEFETERGFVWGAGSLTPFAVYATATCAFVIGVLVWAASVGGRLSGAG
jgi:hypothetical protein